MKTFFTTLALAFSVFVSVPLFADGHKHGLLIEDAWARPSLGTTKKSAAYFIIKNMSKKDVTITGASTPVSGRTEMHTHIKEGDVVKMRELKDGMVIPAGATKSLKPGGDHIMFMDLKTPLKAGDSFILKLETGAGETKKVMVKVQNKAGEHMGSRKDSHKGSHK